MPTKKKYPRPPKKLSDLIALALGDLMKVERSKKRYVVLMGLWHEPGWGNGGQCAVCFAGSVMAKTLRANPGKAHSELGFPSEWWRAFDVIDSARYGFFKGIPRQEVPDYTNSPAAFKRAIRSAIKQLRAVGK